MRTFLKRIIPQSFFPFFRAIDKYVIYWMYFYLALKRFIVRDKVRQVQTVFQSIPIIRSQIQFDSLPSSDLTSILDHHGISYKSGRHSIYISGKTDLSKISSELLGRCLPPYGVKIFKSRELSPDGTPYYTSRVLAPASTYWSMRAVGNISEKVVVSNLLHEEGVAPRVYDLIGLEDENGVRYHAFIVQHVEGPVVHGEEGVHFLQKLRAVFDRFGVAVISISDHCDMRPPFFRDNIIKDRLSTYYVDIQNFAIQDSSKVDEIRERIVARYAGDKLSEIIFSEITSPLSRSNDKALAFQQGLEGLVQQSDLKQQKCIFIDACQGLGTGLFSILGAQGQWGFLLRPKTEHSDLHSFHHLRGYTRFDCVASELEIATKFNEYSFSNQDVCIIFDKKYINSLTITKWDLYQHMIVIDSSEYSKKYNDFIIFGDIVFGQTGLVKIEVGSERLDLSLYLRVD